MKKQSSIEWLVEELSRQTRLYTKEEIIDQAKEMHKQEIIEAREDGFDSTYAEYGETPKCYLDGSSEDYYKNTYETRTN